MQSEKKEHSGPFDRYVEVHLDSGDVREFSVDRERRKRFLGGKGMGLSFLFERMEPGIDPLESDNWIAFMTGVLVGTGAPCSGRWDVITKSPLTGIFTSSSCGGPFGTALKSAGYDGVLVTGRSEAPAVIEIGSEGAEVRDAAELWGLTTSKAQEKLELAAVDGACVIGPAGENGVLYANAASGHRFVGRGGIGAVMGSKNLKGIIARGGAYRVRPARAKSFDRVKKKGIRQINTNPFTSVQFRRYGTGSNVDICNREGLLPVDNFRRRSDPRAQAVSGRAMAERYGTKPSTCKPCSILCGHKGSLPDGTVHQIPEYESVGLLGPNLGVYDPDSLVAMNDLCNELGMDTVSAGGTLSWAMEAGEKGLYRTDLAFGKTEKILETLENIAYVRGNDAELGGGSRRTARKYGGEEFAVQVKGLELAAYDPRGSWGQGLGYAVANRGGCHLSSYLYGPAVMYGLLDPYSDRAKPEWTVYFEDLYAAINCLHTCQFTTFAYLMENPIPRLLPKFLLKPSMAYLPRISAKLLSARRFSDLFSAAVGMRLGESEFLAAGRRTIILERYMNCAEGISRKDDTLPYRFLGEGDTGYPVRSTVPLEPMLDRYYRIRGYDEEGVPSLKTLGRAGLGPEASDVRWTRAPEERRRSGDSRTAGRVKKTPQPPPASKLKIAYLEVLTFFLGRGLQAASKFDPDIRRELEDLPEGFTFGLTVLPRGPGLYMEKTGRGGLKYRGGRPERHFRDLTITFKSIEAAMLVFTFREKTAVAFARDRMTARGELPAAMAVVRCLNAAEVYLLPKFLARKAVKSYPRWSLGRKLFGRIRVYFGALTGV